MKRAKLRIRLSRSVDRAWDFYGADPRALSDPQLQDKLSEDIEAVGFTLVMQSQFHRFEGGGNGISFLAMLMESHVAIHTAPEKDACLEITVHTCEVEGRTSKEATPHQKTLKLIALWTERFKPQRIVSFGDRVRADRSR